MTPGRLGSAARNFVASPHRQHAVAGSLVGNSVRPANCRGSATIGPAIPPMTTVANCARPRQGGVWRHRRLGSGGEGKEIGAMTWMHIHQCPRCELRFTSRSELEDHLSNDHHPRPTNGADELVAAATNLPPGCPPAPVDDLPEAPPASRGWHKVSLRWPLRSRASTRSSRTDALDHEPT